MEIVSAPARRDLDPTSLSQKFRANPQLQGWPGVELHVRLSGTLLKSPSRPFPHLDSTCRPMKRTQRHCVALTTCRQRSSCTPSSDTPRRRRSVQRAGFTLLELLLVLSILVVIGGIVLVNITGAQAEANANATRTQLNSLKSNIQMYQIRMNSLPEALEQLRDGPSDAAKKSKWVAPIITEIPLDAWGNALTYSVNGNTFEIRSGGIDGQANTDDDIIVSG